MDLDWISILDNLAEMVWIMTPEGHGIWVNKQYVRYFGGTYEEMVTQSKGWELDHPDDLPRTVEAVTEWQKHNLEKELHYRLKRHDGVYLWHLARCTLIKHDNSNTVKYLIGTITNIHDQKLAEEKAKLLDEQLKTVMEHAPVMVYAIDIMEHSRFTQEESLSSRDTQRAGLSEKTFTTCWLTPLELQLA
jgi:PAS domain S-box-containing protein